MGFKELSDFFSKKQRDQIIRMLVSATPVSYVILDRSLRVHYVNEALLGFRKLKKGSVVGHTCSELVNNPKICAHCIVKKAFITGEPQKLLRTDYGHNDEVLRYYEDYAIPIYRNKSKDFDFVLEIIVDRSNEYAKLKRRDEDFVEIMHVLSNLLDTKDHYTAQHSNMVRHYSLKIAKEMGLSIDQVNEIDVAASLHDIGKVAISNSIINKCGKLNEQEWEMIKTHPQKSRDMLRNISGFHNVKDIVQMHHERYDGKGYPLGKKGQEIPLGARIIAVADTYDAMTSTRSYRKAMSFEVAVAEIIRNSGTQFDPNVVEAFLKTFVDQTAVEEFENFVSETEEKYTQMEGQSQALTETRSFRRLHRSMLESEFINAVFEYAPVAYVILDEDYKILFANTFFEKYMGLSGEPFFGKECYSFLTGKKCEICPVEDAFRCNKQQTCRLQQNIKGEEKFFDVFAIPFEAHDGKRLMAEVIIDRTEEVSMEKAHEEDFASLIQMMSGLIDKLDFLPKTAAYIAERLGVPQPEIREIEIAASLCNIGMIAMGADGVQLSSEQLYNWHAQKSYDILRNLSGYQDVKKIIYHHHEHYDGSGLPYGLKGDQIPLGSRIIAIAEAIDDKLLNQPQAERDEFLRSCSGSLLDPLIVAKLVE